MLDRIARMLGHQNQRSERSDATLTRRSLLARATQASAGALVAGNAASTITFRANAQKSGPELRERMMTMQQATPTAPVGLHALGAIETIAEDYTRTAPSGTGSNGPVWDTFSLALGRFSSVDAAADSFAALRDEVTAFLDEFWPERNIVELSLPSAHERSSQRLLSGTVSKRGETYFYTWSQFQIEDIVGTLYGFSSWYHTALEVAYLGNIVVERALDADASGTELSTLLPPADLLTGGLQLSD